jgi:hypothetical protein
LKSLLYDFDLTRFLHVNQHPLRSKTLKFFSNGFRQLGALS